MKIEQENRMSRKLIKPLVPIPENSELIQRQEHPCMVKQNSGFFPPVVTQENIEFFQRQQQACMVQQNPEVFTPNVFIPEDVQRLNCAPLPFQQLVYHPLPMEMLPSSCVYCQHLNQFSQTIPNAQNVNFRAILSTDQYCADLPFADKQTFQYFYNLGIEYCQGFYANAASRTENYNNRYKKGKKFKKFFKK